MNLLNPWVRRGAALIAAAALIVPLAACSSGGGKSTGGGGNSQSGSTTLTIGYPSDPAPTGYDPLRYSEGQREFFEGLYDSLFALQPDGSIKPSLVTSFSYSPDNTVLTLKLKSGITFTDGSTLDAALVKENLDRRTDSALTAYTSIAPGGQTALKSVDVVDSDTVALHFATPQPGFQSSLAGVTGMIVGKKGAEDPDSLATTPDGSGAYTLDSKATVKGSSYVLKKNPKSADASNYSFKTIVFKPITDPRSLVNALVSGQVDVGEIDAPDVATAQAKHVAISQVGGTVNSMYVFDKLGKTAPAFGNVKARQALQMAINRKSLVKALHKGEVPAWNALPKESPGFDTSLNDQFAYNPTKAKKLLAEAGYPKGFSFTIIATPQTQTDLQAIQKDFAAIGVTMKVTLASSTEEAFNAVKTTPLGMGPINWANPVGVMNGVIFGFANQQGAKDAALTAATGAVAAAKTDAEQATALKDLNDHLVQDVWLIPLYEILNTQGYNAKKLQKVTFAGTNEYPLLASFKPVK